MSQETHFDSKESKESKTEEKTTTLKDFIKYVCKKYHMSDILDSYENDDIRFSQKNLVEELINGTGDVELTLCNKLVFKCHSVLLRSYSGWFKKHLEPQKCTKIDLSNYSSEYIMLIILHAYFQLDIGELFFGHKNDKKYDVIKAFKSPIDLLLFLEQFEVEELSYDICQLMDEVFITPLSNDYIGKNDPFDEFERSLEPYKDSQFARYLGYFLYGKENTRYKCRACD